MTISDPLDPAPPAMTGWPDDLPAEAPSLALARRRAIATLLLLAAAVIILRLAWRLIGD